MDGLKEDNERISRMYQLVQNEAFQGVDKLKKMNGGLGPVPSSQQPVNFHKKGYQPLKDNETSAVATNLAVNAPPKGT